MFTLARTPRSPPSLVLRLPAQALQVRLGGRPVLGLQVPANHRQEGGEDGRVIGEPEGAEDVGHGVGRQEEPGAGRQLQPLNIPVPDSLKLSDL